jgi:hypothetical protein
MKEAASVTLVGAARDAETGHDLGLRAANIGGYSAIELLRGAGRTTGDHGQRQ